MICFTILVSVGYVWAEYTTKQLYLVEKRQFWHQNYQKWQFECQNYEIWHRTQFASRFQCRLGTFLPKIQLNTVIWQKNNIFGTRTTKNGSSSAKIVEYRTNDGLLHGFDIARICFHQKRNKNTLFTTKSKFWVSNYQKWQFQCQKWIFWRFLENR